MRRRWNRFNNNPNIGSQHQVQYQHSRLNGAWAEPRLIASCVSASVSMYVDKVSHDSFVHIINFNYSKTKTWLIISMAAVMPILHRQN